MNYEYDLITIGLGPGAMPTDVFGRGYVVFGFSIPTRACPRAKRRTWAWRTTGKIILTKHHVKRRF